MRFSLPSGLLLASMAPLASAERVLGAYIFSRHGDRTPKVFGHTQLTDLGYRELFDSGSFYHNRYIRPDSSMHIQGISPSIVNPTQISATAPKDVVIQNSATGFLQGVYPPVGIAASQILANGSTIQAPLGGYQLIPIEPISINQNSENAGWLQGASGCQKAGLSSNEYFSSAPYNALLNSTKSFYQSLSPMLDRTFTPDQMSFKNAYTIFDYLNVARIHNSSANFPHELDLTDEVYHQLMTLASIHEYNLAYNASDPVRAIDGAVLAGEILQALNKTVTSQGKSKLNVQFGSYGTFFSFFGLAKLTVASVDFTGIVDYASTMVFELVTNSTGSGFPSASEISVRFLFHNGTLTGSALPTTYPLYGQSKTLLSWSDFVSETQKIAVLSTSQWCNLCGNTQGQCAANSSTGSSTSSTSRSGGISRAVAGVIGAMVTLAVIFGLEALFFFVGGFRITKRRNADPEGGAPAVVVEDKKA